MICSRFSDGATHAVERVSRLPLTNPRHRSGRAVFGPEKGTVRGCSAAAGREERERSAPAHQVSAAVSKFKLQSTQFANRHTWRKERTSQSVGSGKRGRQKLERSRRLTCRVVESQFPLVVKALYRVRSNATSANRADPQAQVFAHGSEGSANMLHLDGAVIRHVSLPPRGHSQTCAKRCSQNLVKNARQDQGQNGETEPVGYLRADIQVNQFLVAAITIKVEHTLIARAYGLLFGRALE